MRAGEQDIDTRVLGVAAKDSAGALTVPRAEAVALMRRHIAMETLRTGDHDDDLWWLWVAEADTLPADATNEEVLERVMQRVREGD